MLLLVWGFYIMGGGSRRHLWVSSIVTKALQELPGRGPVRDILMKIAFKLWSCLRIVLAMIYFKFYQGGGGLEASGSSLDFSQTNWQAGGSSWSEPNEKNFDGNAFWWWKFRNTNFKNRWTCFDGKFNLNSASIDSVRQGEVEFYEYKIEYYVSCISRSRRQSLSQEKLIDWVQDSSETYWIRRANMHMLRHRLLHQSPSSNQYCFRCRVYAHKYSVLKDITAHFLFILFYFILFYSINDVVVGVVHLLWKIQQRSASNSI